MYSAECIRCIETCRLFKRISNLSIMPIINVLGLRSNIKKELFGLMEFLSSKIMKYLCKGVKYIINTIIIPGHLKTTAYYT